MRQKNPALAFLWEPSELISLSHFIRVERLVEAAALAFLCLNLEIQWRGAIVHVDYVKGVRSTGRRAEVRFTTMDIGQSATNLRVVGQLTFSPPFLGAHFYTLPHKTNVYVLFLRYSPRLIFFLKCASFSEVNDACGTNTEQKTQPLDTSHCNCVWLLGNKRTNCTITIYGSKSLVLKMSNL